MDLSRFDSRDFDRGRARWVEALWLVVSALLVSSWVPGSRHRVALLRLFGAQLGRGVVIKPYIRIKFPWRLRVGDYSWLGESVWIDNLAQVDVGSHCCISQGAYLCTGTHAYDLETFDLITRPILVEDRCWICAKANVAPGTILKAGSVIVLGAVARGTISASSCVCRTD